MSSGLESTRNAGTQRSGFATTAWSRVVRAGSGPRAESHVAIAELCASYWYPLYAYHRRRGARPEEAEDAVQAFFGRLLESNLLSYADPERGRFRGFLVASFRQFLAARHAYESAACRRPPQAIASIDTAEAEARYHRELADHETPERTYDRAWALALLQRTMDLLRDEYAADGRSERFEALRGTLTGQAAVSHRELATRLGTTEGAVRVAVHRLRQRYAELLREEVRATVDDGEDVDSEIRELLSALQPAARA